MKGCHWCTEFKKQLKENKIKFKERDIEKYEEEYNLFVEVTGNDFVPAFTWPPGMFAISLCRLPITASSGMRI